MGKVLAMAVLFTLILGFAIIGNAQEIEKPPLNAVRIAGEVLAGAAGGIALVCIGWIADYGHDPGFGIIFSVSGLVLGSAAGVYLIGDLGNETGSFWVTLGGSAIGFFVGLLASVASEELSDVPEEDFAWWLFLTSPSIAATITFNRTRRYDSTPKTALINFRDGQISLAVPGVYFRSDSFEGKSLSRNLDLLRVRF